MTGNDWDYITNALRAVKQRGYTPDIIVSNPRMYSDIAKRDYDVQMKKLEFKNGDVCPDNYFTWYDYFEVWEPTYGKKFRPEDCGSFKEFKEKLMVAML